MIAPRAARSEGFANSQLPENLLTDDGAATSVAKFGAMIVDPKR